ncbi:MAG: hypothetical protein Q4F12_04560 [Erysipelotrichaceae bacterium]|nr:hypothetical protein [Erysipelotrichaceae bacterium]
MIKLIYRLLNNNGDYTFVADIDITTAEKPVRMTRSVVYYEIFTSKYDIYHKTLISPEANEFIDLVKQAKINTWPDAYTIDNSNGKNELGVYNVCLVAGGVAYFPMGFEGKVPEGYDKLLEAIRMCDKRVTEFLSPIPLDE